MQMAVTEKHFKDNLLYFDTVHDTHMDKTKLNQWIILIPRYNMD